VSCSTTYKKQHRVLFSLVSGKESQEINTERAAIKMGEKDLYLIYVKIISIKRKNLSCPRKHSKKTSNGFYPTAKRISCIRSPTQNVKKANIPWKLPSTYPQIDPKHPDMS